MEDNNIVILDDSSEDLIGTKIETPIRFNINNNIVEVGRFFANIERDLKGISIQIYFNEEDKAIVRDNINLLTDKYRAFYESIVREANLVGWDFIQ